MTKFVVKTVTTTVHARLVEAEDEISAKWDNNVLEEQNQTTTKTTVTLFNDGIITDAETKEVSVTIPA